MSADSDLQLMTGVLQFDNCTRVCQYNEIHLARIELATFSA